MNAADEEREFLLRSLDDLERERAAGDIDEHDYESLRADYTARAAKALRAGAAGEVDTSPQPGRSPARPASGERSTGSARSRTRLPLTLGVTVAVAIGAGVAVARSSGQRQPGQQVSGALPASSQARVDELLAQAREQLSGSPVGALKAFDAVLKIDPAQVEALTYRGWLLYQAGLADEAVTWLDRAVAADPTYPDARVFRGIVRLRARNDPAGAVADLERFLADAPDNPMAPVVRQTLAEAQAQQAGVTTTAARPPTT